MGLTLFEMIVTSHSMAFNDITLQLANALWALSFTFHCISIPLHHILLHYIILQLANALWALAVMRACADERALEASIAHSTLDYARQHACYTHRLYTHARHPYVRVCVCVCVRVRVCVCVRNAGYRRTVVMECAILLCVGVVARQGYSRCDAMQCNEMHWNAMHY